MLENCFFLANILSLRVVSALSSGKQTAQISVNDRVSVFLELAEAHRVLGEQVRACIQTNETPP